MTARLALTRPSLSASEEGHAPAARPGSHAPHHEHRVPHHRPVWPAGQRRGARWHPPTRCALPRWQRHPPLGRQAPVAAPPGWTWRRPGCASSHPLDRVPPSRAAVTTAAHRSSRSKTCTAFHPRPDDWNRRVRAPHQGDAAARSGPDGCDPRAGRGGLTRAVEGMNEGTGAQHEPLRRPGGVTFTRGRDGRGAAIRTRDLLNPIQVRYQAAPRPDRAASLTKVSHAPIWVSLLRARRASCANGARGSHDPGLGGLSRVSGAPELPPGERWRDSGARVPIWHIVPTAPGRSRLAARCPAEPALEAGQLVFRLA